MTAEKPGRAQAGSREHHRLCLRLPGQPPGWPGHSHANACEWPAAGGRRSGPVRAAGGAGDVRRAGGGVRGGPRRGGRRPARGRGGGADRRKGRGCRRAAGPSVRGVPPGAEAAPLGRGGPRFGVPVLPGPGQDGVPRVRRPGKNERCRRRGAAEGGVAGLVPGVRRIGPGAVRALPRDRQGPAGGLPPAYRPARRPNAVEEHVRRGFLALCRGRRSRKSTFCFFTCFGRSNIRKSSTPLPCTVRFEWCRCGSRAR